LWFVAAIILFSALTTVAFGWYVKRSVFLDDTSPLARAAVAVASFPTDTRKVFKELRHRLTGEPNETYIRAGEGARDFSGFVPVRSQLETTIEGLLVRAGPASAERGWRVLVGAIGIGGSIEDAAVLLSPDLEVVRYWLLGDASPENTNPDPPSAYLTHGFAMLTDGSVIYRSDSRGGLQKLDGCGRPVWSADGGYHHSVTADDSGATVWSLRTDDFERDRAAGEKFVQVSVGDGSIVREFSIADIIAANPAIDIFELRRRHESVPKKDGGATPGRWLFDPFHVNDVDPLPRDLADRFPMFAAGDLLISLRELNLISVIDPRTLAVKWWRIGDTIRQHDPDWTVNCRLSVYNNRMTRGHSEIVEIDPATLAKTVTVNGSDIGFYARVGGKHQLMPGGNWLISNPWQGNVVEVSPDGEIALEFASVLDDQKSTAAIMGDAIFLPEDALDAGAFQCAPQ
jgi:hypothetical protein